MRKILPFVVLAAVAACSLPQMRWDKAGVDEKLTAADLVSCRRAARDEAFTAYPFAFGPPFHGYRRWPFWDDDRFYTESRLTDFCMRNKGYQLVAVTPPQLSPPASPTPEK